MIRVTSIKALTIVVAFLYSLKNSPLVFIPKKLVMKFKGKSRADIMVKI